MKRTTSPEVLVHIERRSGVPLRTQLESQLRDAIRGGRLRPGVQLPSTRVLAADGGLGGFSASGGTALKRRLLQIEGARGLPVRGLFDDVEG